MKIRKPITLIVAFAMVFTVFGYGFATQADAAAKKPTKMTISANYKTVDIKGKITVKVKSVSPSNASKAVTWKSSNKKIATVSSSGVVTGKKAGTVKITATSKSNKKLKKTVTVKVKQIKPTLSLKNIYVYTGDGYVAVKASVPSNVYNAGVSYKISSTKYAKLKSSKTSKSGYSSLKARKGYVYIAPVKATTSKVTLTATSKEDKKIKKTCRVYVRQSVDRIAFDSSKVSEDDVFEIQAGTNDIVKASVTKPSKPYSKAIVYSSSDRSVATVDQDGTVTAKKAGYTLITATAKYGNRNKAKASYTLVSYDKLDPVIADNKAEYSADTNKYDFYEINGERKDKNYNMIVDNDGLALITGESAEFDWLNASETSFEKAEFDFSAGDDYIFAKEGNKVTIKFDRNIMRTSWYYVEGKSFKAGAGSDYTITLFSTKDGGKDDATLDIVKKDSKISVEKGSRSASLTKETQGVFTFNVKAADGTEKTIGFKSSSDGIYKIILDKSDVESYGISVKAFAK